MKLSIELAKLKSSKEDILCTNLAGSKNDRSLRFPRTMC